MNTNCLFDMQCPECKSFGPFDISVRCYMRITDDGTDPDSAEGIDWDFGDACFCVDCEHDATVQEFTISAPPAPSEKDSARITIEHWSVLEDRIERLENRIGELLFKAIGVDGQLAQAEAERDEALDVLVAMHGVHRGFSSNDNWTILDDDARAATEALLDKYGR